MESTPENFSAPKHEHDEFLLSVSGSTYQAYSYNDSRNMAVDDHKYGNVDFENAPMPPEQADASQNPPEGLLFNNAANQVTQRSSSAEGRPARQVEDNAVPSRVLHVRNLVPEATENNIFELGKNFGTVTNCLMLQGKGQALLEMETIQEATDVLQYFQEHRPLVCGKPVYVQFSTRPEIRVQKPGHKRGENDGREPNANIPPSNILLASIHNMLYPIAIDVFHTLFSKFGFVEKIVTFKKNNILQAMIQYPNVVCAASALKALNNQDIYDNCCTLRITYSTTKELNVKYNNDRSRDYTSLYQGAENGGQGAPSKVSLMEQYFGGNNFAGNRQWSNNSSMYSEGNYGGNDHMHGHHPHERDMGMDMPHPQMAMHGDMSHDMGHGKRGNGMDHGPMHGVKNHPNSANGKNSQNCVLICSNLNEERITCDSLFTLFGVYADVQRVKILYNKKDTALIQVANPQQAQLAINHLNGETLYGKDLYVSLSHHCQVSLPRDGSDESSMLNKDFSFSAHHRFRVAGSKNYKNIAPPGETLHLSNISEEVSDDDITQEFSAYGTVTAFRFFPPSATKSGSKRMALVKMGSVQEAVEALIGMHNHVLFGHELKVSFSKTPYKELHNAE
eukprot:Nk52_evm14s2011 gene=Nk52_evmTU14s2011